MKSHKLVAEKRTVTGKKVKNLRKEGTLPASIYGAKVKSQSIQVNYESFTSVYNETGETGLIELTIKGATTPRFVLIHAPQRHPVTNTLLHADFHEVQLKEKMTIEVPIHLTGESPIAAKKLGVLLQIVDKLEVEAFPTDLPDEITLDISSLKEIGDELTVKDIKVPSEYVILEDKETVLVRINPLEKEIIPEAAPVSEETTEEGATPEEGKEAPEGETKSENTEKSPEPSKE